MRHLLIAASALTALAGCAPAATTPEPGAGQSFARELSAADRAACLSTGGRVERRGRIGAELCVKPFADAGKSCTDKADCQGRCIATGNAETPPSAGQCQADDRLFGCYTEITSGKAVATICVD